MSEDVERLRRGLDALWKRGDWEAAFAGLPDDFVSRTHAFGIDFDADGPDAFEARSRDSVEASRTLAPSTSWSSWKRD